MAARITSKQSLQARSLLKWSHKDVVSKCSKLRLFKLKDFEKGEAQFTASENRMLREVYEAHDITFTGDFQVKLGADHNRMKTEKLIQDEQIVIEQDELTDLIEESIAQPQYIEIRPKPRFAY